MCVACDVAARDGKCTLGECSTETIHLSGQHTHMQMYHLPNIVGMIVKWSELQLAA